MVIHFRIINELNCQRAIYVCIYVQNMANFFYETRAHVPIGSSIHKRSIQTNHGSFCANNAFSSVKNLHNRIAFAVCIVCLAHSTLALLRCSR